MMLHHQTPSLLKDPAGPLFSVGNPLVALLSLSIGTITGAIMALMFVKILAPLFTILPTTLAVPADQLATLVTLVLCGMAVSVALAAGSLRRLNPVELLREE
jgi:ABC-type antimicrobial peptide transport system permease subunit